MRSYAVVAILLLCLFLVSCFYTPEPVDPYPYSFTDPSKPMYPRTESGARRFLSDVRSQWFPSENDYAQAYDYSYAVMSGDCDDFAIVLAHYLQEYWGYDTFIVLLKPQHSGVGYHVACFVRSIEFPASVIEGVCDNPELTWYGYTYRALDWGVCTFWNWDDYSMGFPVYSWYYDTTYYTLWGLEWDDAMNCVLSIEQ